MCLNIGWLIVGLLNCVENVICCLCVRNCLWKKMMCYFSSVVWIVVICGVVNGCVRLMLWIFVLIWVDSGIMLIGWVVGLSRVFM